MANVKRKVKKTVYEGNVYIQATFNNTIITIMICRATLFLGQVPVDLVSAVPRSLLRMPLRPRWRRPPRPLWTPVCRK